MPKFTCKVCNREFWGWGAYYNYRSHKRGDQFVCPECHGHHDAIKHSRYAILDNYLNGEAPEAA